MKTLLGTSTLLRRATAARASVALLASLAALPLLIAGCQSALTPLALNLGKNLLGVSSENHSDAYAQAIDDLLVLMQTVVPAQRGFVPAPDRPEGALALNVALLKDGDPPVAIEDGAVLRDRGDLSASDKFKITFEPNQSCYVYVFGIDATGWVTPVFPTARIAAANPISTGVQTGWFGLDAYRGVETIYFLASYSPRPDLEAMLADFGSKVRPDKADYLPVEEPALTSRGIVAMGPGKAIPVTSEDGGVHTVTASSFVASLDDPDLVVTRWFKHE